MFEHIAKDVKNMFYIDEYRKRIANLNADFDKMTDEEALPILA